MSTCLSGLWDVLIEYIVEDKYINSDSKIKDKIYTQINSLQRLITERILKAKGFWTNKRLVQKPFLSIFTTRQNICQANR